MENLKFLKDVIKNTGFGETLYPELEKQIGNNEKEFQLRFTTQANSRPFEATLFFRKSDTSEMYFFNRYTASLERTNGQRMEHSFSINKGKGVHEKEAYNLLQGRAVYKDLTNSKGEPYKAWMQLDLDNKDEKGNFVVNKYNEKYGYDLHEALGKFPILEMDGSDKEKDLIRSLERGNAQVASIDKDGEPMKVFLEANPKYKSLNVYDENFKMMKHDDLPRNQQTASQTQRQAPAEKVSDNRQAVKNSNGQKNDGIMKKNRNRQNTGVKM